MLFRISSWLCCLAVVLLSSLLVSCDSSRQGNVAQKEEQPPSQRVEETTYQSLLDPVVWVIRDGEMYSGFEPVDYGSEDFQKAFVPLLRSESKTTGAECVFPASPMDEYGGTIAFGKPPGGDFEGSFVCGNFRFDVANCSEFGFECEARYVRVFSIPNNRYVNYQLWDRCRGIYLISSSDLSDRPEDWKHAGYPINGRGLFSTPSNEC